MWLIPKTPCELARIRQLRAEFERLPPICANTVSSARQQWVENQLELRQCVKARKLRAFLTWRVIARTMFVPYAPWTSNQLSFLQSQSDWNRWKKVLEEHIAGLPFPCPGHRSTSANVVHHAYHLRFFELRTGMRIDAFSLILEFGGGYGSMCRIVRCLGFSGLYLIFDLPEFSAIQRYYLATVAGEAVTVSRFDTSWVHCWRRSGARASSLQPGP